MVAHTYIVVGFSTTASICVRTVLGWTTQLHRPKVCHERRDYATGVHLSPVHRASRAWSEGYEWLPHHRTEASIANDTVWSRSLQMLVRIQWCRVWVLWCVLDMASRWPCILVIPTN